MVGKAERESSARAREIGEELKSARVAAKLSAMSTRDLAWRKSSYSNGVGGECVEVALRLDAVAVRDSKAPEAGILSTPAASWRAPLHAPQPASVCREGHFQGI